MDHAFADIGRAAALQQPPWDDPARVQQVRRELSARPALVAPADVRALRARLARVAEGGGLVVQAGDCAEDPADCTPAGVARRAALLDRLAHALGGDGHERVLRVGRMAGQFGKPRSKPTETVDGVELPVYRGHMVNSPEPDPQARRPDPERLLLGYRAARDAMRCLGWTGRDRRARIGAPVWTSHEMLLLDYELPLVRRDDRGGLLLASTHWPWIGERTRQADGAHVRLLAAVGNPVACKVGPGTSVAEILALCARLDPAREPGRLTFIARMGAATAAERLPALVTAVRGAGHPVIWLVDPMHGNTVSGPGGVKTRVLDTIVREVEEFQDAVDRAGGVAGGLHLETTPDDVTECVRSAAQVGEAGSAAYTTFCDPRLNPEQALTVVSAWRAGERPALAAA